MAFARAQAERSECRRLTLGVAAFSNAQREAIDDRLEALRRDDPSCEAFFDEAGEEPFFVKNLENVQGDERDVIFISVGYGRTAAGQVALNFGPINNEGGERRLNVLITRARLRCEVFTNLTADDLDLGRTPARGVRALKTFLAYARTGRLDAADSPAGEPADATPFEQAVAQVLTAAGQAVRAGVGSGEARLDLALTDPADPGRYRLGLAGDGPGYHAARTARDRDRLRPQVLEGLGWRVHRLWSADWFRDPEGARNRALAAAEAVVEEATGPPPQAAEAAVDPQGSVARDEGPPGGAGNSAPAVAAGTDGPAPEVAAYRLAEPRVDLGTKDLHEVPAPRLAGWLAEVVKVEGPVHVAEATRRVLDAAGVKRAGNRIQAAFDLALEAAARKGTIRREGDFLWPAGLDPRAVAVRDRSALPAASRRLDLVAPEELARAVERVVVDAFGIEPDAVPPAACRLLGFGRVSDEMRRRVDEVVADLVRQNRLEPRGPHLVMPDLKVAS
jgi:hypothetical protein